jgi:hypothetical protein
MEAHMTADNGCRQPVVMIACQVLQSMLEERLPDGLAEQLTIMDYGLHRVPVKMTASLQAAIDNTERPSLVVLGYGLCGNGLKGLRAGRHTLLMPRVHDCIALLLGSRQAYMRQFEAEPGTYYLSKGWLESGSHPLKEYEEYLTKYGQAEAEWLMDQQYGNYRRLALVASTQADLDQYRPQAHAVARFCGRWGYRYQEILGSDDYVRRLVEAAVRLAEPGVTVLPRRLADDFIVIPAGGAVRQDHFM